MPQRDSHQGGGGPGNAPRSGQISLCVWPPGDFPFVPLPSRAFENVRYAIAVVTFDDGSGVVANMTGTWVGDHWDLIGPTTFGRRRLIGTTFFPGIIRASIDLKAFEQTGAGTVTLLGI